MNNVNEKNREKEKQMGCLQDKLDIAVFEQEEIDPEQVRAILKEMEHISPSTEETQEKELRWEKIRREYRKDSKAEKSTALTALEKHKKNFRTIRKIALMAATLVLALFIGTNIGTYATGKKSVFEFVADLGNGTAYRINGEIPSMEVEKTAEVYYSWNDVPSEYESALIKPKGVPEELNLYEIKVNNLDTNKWIKILYLNDTATENLSIRIVDNNQNEFTFKNLLYEEDYVLVGSKRMDDIDISYYQCEDGDIMAQFLYKYNWYIFSGNIELELLQNIVEDTIKENF